MKKLILLLFIPLIFSCSEDDSCEPAPKLTTAEAENITDVSATISGTITPPTCDDTVTSQGFVYGEENLPTVDDNKIIKSGSSISASLTNLNQNTTYYFRTFFENPLGVFYGNEIVFTTAVGDALISLGSFSDISTGSAKTTVGINSSGGGNISTKGVCYSTSTEPTLNDSKAEAGSGNAGFSITLESLDNNTKYYARAYATNEKGTFYSEERSFTTLDFDNDEDGIYNYEDNCIDTANPEQKDADGDGIGDVCDDSDEDGIMDDMDTCPDTRNGVPVDENGCMSNPIYLDENGVTIKSYDWGEVGDTGEVNGVTYTIVSVTQLRGMIYNNEDFSKVCTSKINIMSSLFSLRLINADISSWDVSNVTEMKLMFGNIDFIQDLSNWDVSSVTDMSSMFFSSGFNGDISNWDVSSVTNMSSMFWTSQFNGDISNWDVSSVTNMSGMFINSDFNGNISNWDVSSVTDMNSMFGSSEYAGDGSSDFNGDISNWDVSSVTNMSSMFINSEFNGDISNWDVSSVTTMYRMFEKGSQFNGDISNWDVSSVTDMFHMFYNNEVFNQDLSGWNVSSVNRCNSFSRNTQQWTLPKPNFTNCDPN